MCQEYLTLPAASLRTLGTASAQSQTGLNSHPIPVNLSEHHEPVLSRAVSTTVCDYLELLIGGQAQVQMSNHLL